MGFTAKITDIGAKMTKQGRGRPSSFTQEIADEICVRISGGESLRSIVLGSHMPDRATVFRWLVAHQNFRDQYARAREAHADSLVDDMLAIADAEYELSLIHISEPTRPY